MLPMLKVCHQSLLLCQVRFHISVNYKVSEPLLSLLKPRVTQLCELVISKLLKLQFSKHIIHIFLSVLGRKPLLPFICWLGFLRGTILALSDGLSLGFLDVSQVLERWLFAHASWVVDASADVLNLGTDGSIYGVDLFVGFYTRDVAVVVREAGAAVARAFRAVLRSATIDGDAGLGAWVLSCGLRRIDD